MSKKTEQAIEVAKKYRLSFIIEKRGNYLIMDWRTRGGYGSRPATEAEIQLWQSLINAHAKKEERKEMSIPSQRTIKRRLKELRQLIDTSKDPVVCRIAYAMETAITWATSDTFGWQTPSDEAVELAALLRQELK